MYEQSYRLFRGYIGVFPRIGAGRRAIQSCIIHHRATPQIRNSHKYVASKDQKTFMQELKTVYQAPTKDKAEMELDKINNKWGVKYPVVIKSWQNHWHKLSMYFTYDEQIRRIIYTTNAVEGFHRQVRKITKTKGAFPNDMALLKLIYLAVENISRKWTSPLQNWALTAQQLHIKFGDRMRMDL